MLDRIEKIWTVPAGCAQPEQLENEMGKGI